MDWLNNIGGWELVVIILIGLFIFGPDRLPKAIGEGARMIRQLRQMARNATSDLSRELGTTIELEDLRPQTFLRKHLLSEEDEKALRQPLETIYSELRNDLRDVGKSVEDVASSVNGAARAAATDLSPGTVVAAGKAAVTGHQSGASAVANADHGGDLVADHGGPEADHGTGLPAAQPTTAAPASATRHLFDDAT